MNFLIPICLVSTTTTPANVTFKCTFLLFAHGGEEEEEEEEEEEKEEAEDNGEENDEEEEEEEKKEEEEVEVRVGVGNSGGR